MKIIPLSDRVIVRQSEALAKTESGILLPDVAQEKPTKGTVVAVGPGRLNDKGARPPVGVAVDEVVYYGRYAGSDVEVNGERYVILREPDLLAVLES